MSKLSEGIPRPQLPSGIYWLAYKRHWLHQQKEGLKLYIRFSVCEGDHAGVEIVRIFNVQSAKGKRRFKVSKSHALWAEFCAVMHGHIDTTAVRLDEIPLNRLAGVCIKAKVRIVKKSSAQVPLVGGASYSVVANLLGTKAAEVRTSEPDDGISCIGKLVLEPTPIPALIPIPGTDATNAGIETTSGDDLGINAANGDDDHTEWLDDHDQARKGKL